MRLSEDVTSSGKIGVPQWWRLWVTRPLWEAKSEGIPPLWTGLFGAAVAALGAILWWIAPDVATTEENTGVFKIVGGTASVLGIIAAAVGVWVAAVAFVAIRRFKEIFCFLPPITPEGEKALKGSVHAELRRRARDLKSLYDREETLSSLMLGLSLPAAEIAPKEHELRALRGLIRQAKREFYRARDAACSQCLPISFEVPMSYKDYLRS